MRARRSSIVLGLALIVALAGCGAAGAAGSSTSSSSSGSSNSGNYGYGGSYGGSSTSTSTSGSSASGVAQISTKTVAVAGKQETVLADSKGMTLYYFTPDTATTIACTGSCQQIWPPLLSSGTPTSKTTLPGKLTLVPSGSGQQVEYNGHPLYTYSGDSTSTDANGEGIQGKWFVATPSLSANG